MDRQIVIASVIALTLVAAVKIHPPIEAGANSEMANTQIQAAGATEPSTFTQHKRGETRCLPKCRISLRSSRVTFAGRTGTKLV